MSFTILVLHLLIHFLIFLFVISIIIVFYQISYLLRSLLGLYFPGSSSSSSKPFKKFMVCYYVFVASNPFEFLHYYFCAPCNMATFHAFRRSNFTIMVDDLGMVVVF
jgi:hypothetical protein